VALGQRRSPALMWLQQDAAHDKNEHIHAIDVLHGFTSLSMVWRGGGLRIVVHDSAP
jgi:hypothetical protein